MTGNQIRDITNLEVGFLDLLVGGPPCQGFSIIGRRKLGDRRNGLFFDFMRLARELRPKAILIENVTGLATLHNGAMMKIIAESFGLAGYIGQCAELLAAQYGVPQLRWRMFFVGCEPI